MPKYQALETSYVRALQTGGVDANDQPAERMTSDGTGNPCRHCLREIPKGHQMLVLAHRPFKTVQPYAEVGPIFICAHPCERPPDTSELPDILKTSPDYLIKGYDHDERIVYGTGAVVAQAALSGQIARILSSPRVAFVHIRSARNNCYQARAERD